MYRLLVDCGDYEGALKFTNGPERRMARIVEICAEQVMQCMGVSDGEAEAYVLGVCKQARFDVREESGNYWLDLPAGDVAAAFQMLDTHRRRLLRSCGWTGGMRFNAGVTYARMADGIVIRAKAPTKPSTFRVKLCVAGGVG